MSFKFGSPSKRDKKSAAMFILPGLCAVLKMKIGSKIHAIHNGGGIILA